MRISIEICSVREQTVYFQFDPNIVNNKEKETEMCRKRKNNKAKDIQE